MARSKPFRHKVIVEPALAITASYAAAKRTTISLGMPFSGDAFLGNINSLVVQVSSIASSAAKISFKLATDTGGDEIIIPTTEADIDTGITTAADGAIAARIDLDVGLSSGDTLYLFYKTDTGTCTVDKVIICWSE